MKPDSEKQEENKQEVKPDNEKPEENKQEVKPEGDKKEENKQQKRSAPVKRYIELERETSGLAHLRRKRDMF